MCCIRFETQPGVISATDVGYRLMPEGQTHGEAIAVIGLRADLDIVAKEGDVIDRHGQAIVDARIRQGQAFRTQQKRSSLPRSR